MAFLLQFNELFFPSIFLDLAFLLRAGVLLELEDPLELELEDLLEELDPELLLLLLDERDRLLDELLPLPLKIFSFHKVYIYFQEMKEQTR